MTEGDNRLRERIRLAPAKRSTAGPEQAYIYWVMTVFSPEPMREGAMILCEEQNKKSNVGTISYIPALFGIGCASVVIRDLIGELEG